MRHPQGGGAGGNGVQRVAPGGGRGDGRVAGGRGPSVTFREGPGLSGYGDRAPVCTRTRREGWIAGRSRGRDRGVGFKEQGPECGSLTVVRMAGLRGLCTG